MNVKSELLFLFCSLFKSAKRFCPLFTVCVCKSMQPREILSQNKREIGLIPCLCICSLYAQSNPTFNSALIQTAQFRWIRRRPNDTDTSWFTGWVSWASFTIRKLKFENDRKSPYKNADSASYSKNKTKSNEFFYQSCNQIGHLSRYCPSRSTNNSKDE